MTVQEPIHLIILVSVSWGQNFADSRLVCIISLNKSQSTYTQYYLIYSFFKWLWEAKCEAREETVSGLVGVNNVGD